MILHQADWCRARGIERVAVTPATPEQDQQAIRNRIDLLKIAAARWEPRPTPARDRAHERNTP